MKINFKLHQIKNIADCPYSFMGINFAEKFIDFKDYKKTYEGELSIHPDTITEVLDLIFHLGNTGELPDYRTRSISVSDIIEIDDRFFYVNTIGFREICFE